MYKNTHIIGTYISTPPTNETGKAMQRCRTSPFQMVKRRRNPIKEINKKNAAGKRKKWSAQLKKIMRIILEN